MMEGTFYLDTAGHGEKSVQRSDSISGLASGVSWSLSSRSPSSVESTRMGRGGRCIRE